MELGAGSSRHAVHRPDRGRVGPAPLRGVDLDAHEGAVVGRMPVARGDHEVEAVEELVDRPGDPIAVGDRQRAARREVVLEVDDQEGVQRRNGMDLAAARARRSPDGLLAGRGSYSRHAMAGAGREERAWVRAAQAGSASDLEALFRHHWAGAYRAAYLVVHDAAAAEDIAQEAFLSAIRALDSFDRRRPFGPWLHRIVVNRAIDWTRARALRREVGDEQLAVTPARAGAAPDELEHRDHGRARLALAGPPRSRRPPLRPRLLARRDRRAPRASARHSQLAPPARPGRPAGASRRGGACVSEDRGAALSGRCRSPTRRGAAERAGES